MADTEAHLLDLEDMARLASGHDAALNDLMARHARPVFNYLHRMIGDEQEAADLAQEVFVRVYRHRNHFGPGRRFSPWLYTIATNLALNHIAWRHRRPDVSLDQNVGDSAISLGDTLPSKCQNPSDAIQTEERNRAVRSAIAAIPDSLRAPLLLFEFESHSMAEVAEILGISAKAVESRLFRARQHLHTELAKWLAEAT